MPPNASRDQNYVTTLLAVSNVDGITPVKLYADPVTHRLLVSSSGSGSGDVVGPASSTDNAVARFDGITGKLLQNSLMTIDDAGAFIATDGSKVSGNEGGGFGYIVLAIENTNSGGRAELSLDTDDGAFAGFVTMAGSATTNEQRQFDLGTRVAGDIGFWTTDVERMTLRADGTALEPKTSDTIALGTNTNMWSDLFLASGAVINFNNGNSVITHSSGILTVSTGDLRVTTAGTNTASVVTVGGTQTLTSKTLTSAALNTCTVGTSLVPTSNDGATLGNATNQFSDLFLATGAVINFNNGNVTLTQSANKLSMAGGDLTIAAAETPLIIQNTTDAASVEGFSIEGDRATPANNDEVYQTFRLSDSAGNQTSFARFVVTATTVTDTSETADLKFQTISAGTLSSRAVLNASAFRPNANDGIALGSATVSFSDLFLASGGVINFNNGNATLTHSTGLITSNVAFSIGTSNALTAGTIELGAASDTTISRVSAGVIAVEGVTVPTISSTSTLTNKRIQPRTASSTSAATLTPDVSSASVYYRTTQTVGLTINAPTGTPVIGETIIIYVDSAGAQTLTINSAYKAFGAAFPASTTAGKTFMMSAQYNGTDWKTLWANAV